MIVPWLNNLPDKETFERIDTVQACQGRKRPLNPELFLALQISTMMLTQAEVRRSLAWLEGPLSMRIHKSWNEETTRWELEILTSKLQILWAYRQTKKMCLMHSSWFLHKLHIEVIWRPLLESMSSVGILSWWRCQKRKEYEEGILSCHKRLPQGTTWETSTTCMKAPLREKLVIIRGTLEKVIFTVTVNNQIFGHIYQTREGKL